MVVFALMAGCLIGGFNGLYGQDAHEYLWLSKLYAMWLEGQPRRYFTTAIGEAEFAVGYPFLGALLRLLTGKDILAMQLISWFSIGMALYLFDRLLHLLTPGARREARWVYALIALAMSPYFIRAGITVMSDAFGLALLLAALWFGFRQLEFSRRRDAIWSACFIGWCVITRYSAAPFLLPLAIAIAYNLVQKRQWAAMALAAMAGWVALLPHFWIKAGVPQGLFAHSLMVDWSPLHAFQRTFTTVSGTIHYPFPNIVFATLYPLLSPGFFPLLPLLFFLFMKTDWLLPVKKMLLVCLGLHALFLMGLPSQNARYLMPDFIALLLIMFPAWDRFFAYGFYFLKHHWMRSILAAGIVVQVVSTVWILGPTIRRNRLEQEVVAGLRRDLPEGANLYAFDLDVAIKSYMPHLNIFNLWEHRYNDFPGDAYILFNEPALKDQWTGQNPMLNWEDANENYELQPLETFPNGWSLYKLEAKE